MNIEGEIHSLSAEYAVMCPEGVRHFLSEKYAEKEGPVDKCETGNRQDPKPETFPWIISWLGCHHSLPLILIPIQGDSLI
jgi:hypothetical protein